MVAGSTGGLAGALFGLAREVAFGEPSGLGPTCPLPPFEPEGWTLDLPSVIFGLCLGLLLGPLLGFGLPFPSAAAPPGQTQAWSCKRVV